MNTSRDSGKHAQLPAILHLDSGSTWGGGQKQVLLLMRELARLHVRQLCLCPRNSALAARLQEHSLPVQPIPWRGSADMRAAASIWHALSSYHLAHCHDAHALQLAVLPALFRSRPIVAARRIPYPVRPLKWNRASRVIAVSQTVRDSLVQSRVDVERIRVVNSGIDVDHTRTLPATAQSWRRSLGIPADGFVVVNAGSLVPLKNQSALLAAAAKVNDVHWIIAGEGPERSRLEADVQRYGLAGRVHLPGFIADIRPVISEANIYVSPARIEGLGNAILEALALGVPALSADSGGGAEVLAPVHAATGASFFQPEDPDSMVKAIQRLRDPQIRAAVVALQNRRLADFDIRTTAAATIEIYREITRT